MPNTIIIACKPRQEYEPLWKRKQFENGQSTYKIPVIIQFGWRTYQIHGVTSMVMIPISRLHTIYRTPIMTT
jgi:hypothetical protein